MNIELLKRLCETPGIPGREERVRELIRKEVADLFDEIRVDQMGNMICRRSPTKAGKGSQPTRVMLACHMDEIGFYVKHIDDKGFIRVQNAGGFDARNLFSRRVTVCSKRGGDLPGVMNPGGRPIHIASEEDKKKIPEIKEFLVDLGMSAAEVRKHVEIGDMVVWDEPFREMGAKVVSKALDNRVACWLGIESVRAVASSKTPHSCEIYSVFTVQEEVGLRGAFTASRAVRPDIGIGLDVTLSCDTPGVPEDEAVTLQGEGAVLHVMDGSIISEWTLIDELETVARDHKIKTQRSILARGGQDGAAMQMANDGSCRAAGLTVGTRYIHTVTEMVHRSDLEAARALLAAYIPTVA